MKIVSSPLADPDAAARKLVELANAVEPVQDGRIHIEKINGPLLYQLKGTPEDADGGDALSDEDAAEGGGRDGDARARLQPHARDEHRRYQTAPRRDPGLRSVYCCARRVTVQVAQHGSRLRPD